MFNVCDSRMILCSEASFLHFGRIAYVFIPSRKYINSGRKAYASLLVLCMFVGVHLSGVLGGRCVQKRFLLS
jgi:hypothetical protein